MKCDEHALKKEMQIANVNLGDTHSNQYR